MSLKIKFTFYFIGQNKHHKNCNLSITGIWRNYQSWQRTRKRIILQARNTKESTLEFFVPDPRVSSQTKKKLSLGKYLWIKPFQITPDILLIPNIKRIQRKYLYRNYNILF